MKPLRGVILDCDGTLVDSERLTLKVLAEYVTELGAVGADEQALARFTGIKLDEAFASIERDMDRPMPADHMQTFRERQYEALRTELQPIPGARRLLESLRVPFCVASNAPHEKIQLCLTSAGLIEHVDPSRIFSAYDVDAWKPDPALFLAAADKLGVAADECVVVEDSLPGIQAGMAAGMEVLAFDPQGTLPTDLKGVQRFRTLDDIRECLDAAV